MSELREDALTGRLVLLSPGRAARPHTAGPHTAGTDSDTPRDRAAPPTDCPFCPGAEDQTPPEVHRTGPGAPDTPGWRVRVFPNLYPIVGPDAQEGATGAHEVIVLSPAHDRSFGGLSDAEAVEVFTVLRNRARAHVGAGRTHVQVLLNHGREAGASIAHPHAQLLALDIVPPAVAVAAARFEAAPADLVLADLALASEQGQVVVDGARGAAAWCPSAGSSPYLVRVAALDAGPRFDEAGDESIAVVARTLRAVLAALGDALGDPAYNVVVQTMPAPAPGRFHWYAEVVPRVAFVAGFELGTGVYVNSVAPAAAAALLRTPRT